MMYLFQISIGNVSYWCSQLLRTPWNVQRGISYIPNHSQNALYDSPPWMDYEVSNSCKMYSLILFLICPVSRLWCMRFEAKHSYFKMLAHRVRNFRNIPKTLACRHQRLMCYYLHHPDSSVLLKGMKTGKGMNINYIWGP